MIGEIWETSWGYDQTNVEFFEVVRESEKSLWLRRISADVRDGRIYPLAGEYTTDYGLMGNSEELDRETGEWVPARAYVRDRERGYSEKVCRKEKAHRSVRIDDVRYAWPYEGGGAYDTRSAGLPGH